MTHPFNKPATLRDVLEARNFVARTVLDAANTILGGIVAFFVGAVLVVANIRGYDHWWNWLVGAVIYGLAWKYVRLPPSKSLVTSEEACEKARSDAPSFD